jgi:SAM-dependent methyltransferase
VKILNLGCGLKTSDKPGLINIDWSVYLRLRKMKILRPIVPLLIGAERFKRFQTLSDNIMVHDLAKGIPFDSDSVDVIYHSHMLEHLDRDVAVEFLAEARRVLRPGGIHRIVVPDFEKSCRAYITHIALCETDPSEFVRHDSYVAEMLEQSVRREGASTSQQRPMRRFIEKLVLGDARQRGEMHQWMYDSINLKAKLDSTGYGEVHVQDYNTSLIPAWNEYGLDVDEKGNQYKPESLYVEAIK